MLVVVSFGGCTHFCRLFLCVRVCIFGVRVFDIFEGEAVLRPVLKLPKYDTLIYKIPLKYLV